MARRCHLLFASCLVKHFAVPALTLAYPLLLDCTRVKKALPSLNQSSIKILELDEMSNGSELQNSLAEKTGQRSVPNIFINGTHVGGCDDFFAKQKSGEIEKLLKQ